MNRKSNGSWETIETTIEQTINHDGQPKFKFTVRIDQFVFNNGNRAAPKANVIIEYNNRFLRIPIEEYMNLHQFFKTDEPCMLAIERTAKNIKEIQKKHHEDVQARRKKEIENHQKMIENLANQNKNKNVGTGLSKCSQIDKEKKSTQAAIDSIRK